MSTRAMLVQNNAVHGMKAILFGTCATYWIQRVTQHQARRIREGFDRDVVVKMQQVLGFAKRKNRTFLA